MPSNYPLNFGFIRFKCHAALRDSWRSFFMETLYPLNQIALYHKNTYQLIPSKKLTFCLKYLRRIWTSGALSQRFNYQLNKQTILSDVSGSDSWLIFCCYSFLLNTLKQGYTASLAFSLNRCSSSCDSGATSLIQLLSLCPSRYG